MSISFLLGAGVSIPAGMATTDSITQAVLTPESYIQHSDQTFFKLALGVSRSDYWYTRQPNLKPFLEILRMHCASYFSSNKAGRIPSYEDLYYAASQLAEHLSQEYENPVIEPFVRKIRDHLDSSVNNDELLSMAKCACQYIHDVAAIELSKPRNSSGRHLECLIEALRDPGLRVSEIITLNHDTLIESVLEQAGIPFVDGFGGLRGDVCWWDPSLLRNPIDPSCRLLKLHGSVDWMRFDGRLAKTRTSDVDHAHSDGMMLPITELPGGKLLLGTFNKVRDYFSQPYFDLVGTCRELLSESENLIVSGYSFGDKGVNTLLGEWFSASGDSRLFILHEQPEECLRHARGAIRNLWDRHGGKRIITVPRYLCDCDWAELAPLLVN